MDTRESVIHADQSEAPPPCTCFAVRRLARTVTRFYDQTLAPSGLKTTQYSLMKALRRGPVATSLLAAELGLERTSLTRNAEPLIDQGLVERLAGKDRRERLLRLTAEGERRLAIARKAWHEAEAQLRERLGDDAALDLRALSTHAHVVLARWTVDP